MIIINDFMISSLPWSFYFLFSAPFWNTSPNSFLLQPPFTISAPTIILWHSYSLPRSPSTILSTLAPNQVSVSAIMSILLEMIWSQGLVFHWSAVQTKVLRVVFPYAHLIVVWVSSCKDWSIEHCMIVGQINFSVIRSWT
jgi:hypothetical protein